jgi:potassium-transporting ATPase KdpC subunit
LATCSVLNLHALAMDKLHFLDTGVAQVPSLILHAWAAVWDLRARARPVELLGVPQASTWTEQAMTEPAEPAPEGAASPSGTVGAVSRSEPSPEHGEVARSPSVGTLLEQGRPLLLAVPLLTLLTGAAFPLLLAVLACPLFPHQAGGSLLKRNGAVVGSELIGQNFAGRGYFHPRPSGAGKGYDGLASGGTNLSPSNPKLRDEVRRFADEYRDQNGLSHDAVIPVDAVTRSGSGLDPHISPANAALQLPRVARERGLGEDEVRRLVADHTCGRQLGVLGEPCVEVLPLNLALDRLTPLAAMPLRR